MNYGPNNSAEQKSCFFTRFCADSVMWFSIFANCQFQRIVHLGHFIVFRHVGFGIAGKCSISLQPCRKRATGHHIELSHEGEI